MVYKISRQLIILLQILCGPDNMIYNSVVKWPGSTHDAKMFRHSAVKKHLENCMFMFQFATMRFFELFFIILFLMLFFCCTVFS